MCRGCAVDVPWMCRGCAVDVPWMCRGCAVDVPWMCRGCAVDVPWMCRGCAVAAEIVDCFDLANNGKCCCRLVMSLISQRYSRHDNNYLVVARGKATSHR